MTKNTKTKVLTTIMIIISQCKELMILITTIMTIKIKMKMKKMTMTPLVEMVLCFVKCKLLLLYLHCVLMGRKCHWWGDEIDTAILERSRNLVIIMIIMTWMEVVLQQQDK